VSIVVITGCSSGFGRLAAIAFAKRGDRVFATMRNPAKAQPLLDGAKTAGVSVEVVPLDVTLRASVDNAIAQIVAAAGRIDVLVNNAGIGAVAAVEDFDDDEFMAVFDTNVFGVIRVTRAVLPHMRKQGSGRVINVGSLAGVVSSPFRGIYSASKAAVEALTDALYYELHPFGITASVVEPGFFATSIGENRMPTRRQASSDYADLLRRYEDPSSRAPEGSVRADPQIVADVIVQAATDDPPRRRYLVGKDAEAIGALHKKLSDEEFENVMRATLSFWD
jgi:NAD(P)-dependent dehydrogenase (short-subunit alcohol dehydrogenase family)